MATIDNENGSDLSTTEARGAVELNSVRWVLRGSLLLAVIAGAVIYFSFFPL